jgi:hypothetical protein
MSLTNNLSGVAITTCGGNVIANATDRASAAELREAARGSKLAKPAH